MNETVKAFIEALKKLSPGDRLAALIELDGYKPTLILEAVGQAQQAEAKPAQ